MNNTSVSYAKRDRTATLTTLVIGNSAVAREAAIAADLEPGVRTVLILEGLPSGNTSALPPAPDLVVVRIAPGCFCCTGNLAMRVTLNRILRHPPGRLYISLASSGHVDSVRVFLSAPPYNELLKLSQDLAV